MAGSRRRPAIRRHPAPTTPERSAARPDTGLCASAGAARLLQPLGAAAQDATDARV